MIIPLAIIFSILGAPAEGFDLIQDYQVSYTLNAQNEAEVTISWTLVEPAEKLFICRGEEGLAVLPGDTTSYTLTETNFGEFQYSLGWVKWGLIFQWETYILNIGKLVWDPPDVLPDGYLIFVADTPEDLTSPSQESLEVSGGETQMVLLKELVQAGLIKQGIPQYIAAASYVNYGQGGGNEKLLSKLTDPLQVEITYETALIPWAKPKVPSNFRADF